jgi:hypothetical protein
LRQRDKEAKRQTDETVNTSRAATLDLQAAGIVVDWVWRRRKTNMKESRFIFVLFID